MTKSILISIQPKHLFNILNGIKTLELRKSVPKDFKGWVYIYCAKSRNELSVVYIQDENDEWESIYSLGSKIDNARDIINLDILNGKVVARFWFDEYTKLKWLDGSLNNENMIEDYNYFYLEGNKRYYSVDWLLNNLQLTKVEVSNYGNKKELYAWHIKQLEIFDTPLSLNDFYKQLRYPDGEIITPNICEYSPFDYDDDLNTCLKSFELKKAPQSWQYVYRKCE